MVASALPRPRGDLLTPGRATVRLPIEREQARARAVDEDTERLVAALRRGEARARTELVRRHLPLIERLVAAALGPDAEIPDVVHDVFVRALEGIDKLKDPQALPHWLSTLAVFTARDKIRRRRRWRWIRFLAPEEIPEAPARSVDADARATLRAAYLALAT